MRPCTRKWDWNEAEARFREAIRHDPGYPVAHHWYANHLTAMGRFPEALRDARAASELDPLSMIAYSVVGWVQLHARAYEAAAVHLESVSARDSSFELAHLWKGQAPEGLGDLPAAEASLRRIVEISGGSPISRAAPARVLGASGHTEEAKRMIDDLRTEPGFRLLRDEVGLADAGPAR